MLLEPVEATEGGRFAFDTIVRDPEGGWVLREVTVEVPRGVADGTWLTAHGPDPKEASVLVRCAITEGPASGHRR